MRLLLEHGIEVRAIVRSAGRLPPEARDVPGLSVVEAELLSMSESELLRHIGGCDAVISCLGHSLSLKGVFGWPRDLVTQAVKRVCRAIESMAPSEPMTFILMSSVSVNRPDGLDARRGRLERAFLWALRGLLPPARDNQRAADFLCETVGAANPRLRWVIVRPDSLLETDEPSFDIHEGLVDSLFAPGATSMSNVARFMRDLVENPALRDAWAGKMPVIVDAR